MSPTATARVLHLLLLGLFSGVLLGFFLVVSQVDPVHANLDVSSDQLLQAILRPEVEPGDRQHARLASRDVNPASTGIVVVPVHEAPGWAEARADLAGRARVIARTGLVRQALQVREQLDFRERHLFG
jgi:hypothetical protein